MCPSDIVMTGRYHKGDENEQTQYATAIIKIDNKTTTLEEGITSSSIPLLLFAYINRQKNSRLLTNHFQSFSRFAY